MMLKTQDYGPWNPGLGSTIPNRLMHRVTLFDSRNVTTSWEEARELADVTGLAEGELATFRPERLALHQILIRVTGELHIPDGPDYADLGINLRTMVSRIYNAHVVPKLETMRAEHASLRRQSEAILAAELARALDTKPPVLDARPGVIRRLLGRSSKERPATRTRAHAAMGYVRQQGGTGSVADLEVHCRRALSRVLGAVLSRRGALLVDDATIIRVATTLVGNTAGCDLVGKLVAPLFDAAVDGLGYRRLPPQAEPVVLNTKGASASGKSTIRGRQQQLAVRLGLDWRDFAIISPDYWRKQLIDYASLGDDYKYAAMLAGQELEIIDQKLDRLLTRNAAERRLPHLLVDRFRFDSFQVADSTGPGKLLVRSAAQVFVFFMITPPADTVVRAWQRGLETGRYKAVDDILHHNIEAYSGIPDLFFYWALRERKSVSYEFLDNSVPKGERPRTIAFGSDGSMVILDLRGMENIVRFEHVDANARETGSVCSRQLSEEEALSFVRRCCSRLQRVDFVRPHYDRIYATARNGSVVVDPHLAPAGFPAALIGRVRQAEHSLGRLAGNARRGTIGAFAVSDD